MCFSEQISKMRKQNHLTQEELANKLGITFQAVSKWENGLSYPDITLLPTLADIFGCSIDALFEHPVKQPVLDVSPEVAALTLTPELPGIPVPQSDLLGVHVDSLPWEDDGVLHMAVFMGHQYIGRKLDADENALAKQYTFVYEGEAPVSIACDLNLSCGNVDGEVSVGGNLQCTTVNGAVSVGGNLECEQIDCAECEISVGGNLTCHGGIEGAVHAGGNITAETIEGTAAAGGNLHVNVLNGIANGAKVQTGMPMGGFESLGQNISHAVNSAISRVCNTGALEQMGENISRAVDQAVHGAYGSADTEHADLEQKIRELEQKARAFEQQARVWEAEARKWEAMAGHYDGDMQMSKKARFSCDSYIGNLSFAEKGRIEADTIQSQTVRMADNAVIEVDQLQSETVSLGEHSAISVDSIHGTVSITSGKIEADHIESLAIANGEIHADCVQTVIVSGGHVTVYAEDMPRFEYRNDGA